MTVNAIYDNLFRFARRENINIPVSAVTNILALFVIFFSGPDLNHSYQTLGSSSHGIGQSKLRWGQGSTLLNVALIFMFGPALD